MMQPSLLNPYLIANLCVVIKHTSTSFKKLHFWHIVDINLKQGIYTFTVIYLSVGSQIKLPVTIRNSIGIFNRIVDNIAVGNI